MKRISCESEMTICNCFLSSSAIFLQVWCSIVQCDSFSPSTFFFCIYFLFQFIHLVSRWWCVIFALHFSSFVLFFFFVPLSRGAQPSKWSTYRLTEGYLSHSYLLLSLRLSSFIFAGQLHPNDPTIVFGTHFICLGKRDSLTEN